MNPRRRFQQARDGMESKAQSVKEKATGPAKEKIDQELGIYIHKNIGTLFYFDKQVREYEKNIIEYARNGEKEQAVIESELMKGYILYEMRHNRRYKKQMKKLADRIEENKDEFVDRVENMSESKLIKWLEKRNREPAGDNS